MRTVAILGAGELGSAVAHAVAGTAAASRVLLVDPFAHVASGKALDIRQAGAISAFTARVDGTSDVAAIIGCDVCVIADRAGTPGGEWRHDDGLDTIARAARDIGRAPLVMAGTSQQVLMRTLHVEFGVERRRLVGSSIAALGAAVRAMVALEAGCSVTEVSLSVLGRPPAGLVVPWAEASLSGYALEKVLTQAQLARVEARVARLWPPGPFVLGKAAADVVEAMLGSSRRPRTVLTILDGEFGARRSVGAVPAYLDPSGVARTQPPSLHTRERVLVETALNL